MNKKLNIKNTYYECLNKNFYTEVEPTATKNLDLEPKFAILNKNLISEFGLDIFDEKFLLDIFSGRKNLENFKPISQAYAGHQFGYFTMLGDGRAVLIAEIEKNNKVYDIQLKGAGKTPYSRRGDGKAALSPMLREFIISEAMYHLNIPTTRSLAVVETGDSVYREIKQKGAILTRLASSHIRVGTFEYASNFTTYEELKKLVNYTIERHFPEIFSEKDETKKYLKFLKAVINLQAQLVAKWNLVGFVHGVMNTDNMSISGETIDYGPCAFMDNYQQNMVFSSIDTYGRYRYKNQPHIALWNLTVFAESLLPLFYYEKSKINNEKKEINKLIETELLNFNQLYKKYWLSGMRAKLGLFSEQNNDEILFNELLEYMEIFKADYTNTFVDLTKKSYISKNTALYSSLEFKNWLEKWEARKILEKNEENEIKKLMMASNPFVIPRNHIVEEVLKEAENGNFNSLNKFLEILSEPFNYEQNIDEKYLKGNPSEIPYKTYCGT